MSDEVLVSICCITYNHENYIRDCLEGFLMQKTDFPYEVLIHDDSSVDRTGGIIREYAHKYPDLVKPIIQTENQYSKGVSINYEHNIRRAKGKFIAICEGDDYWTDEYKLQKQIDYLVSNPFCSFCFHNAKVVNFKGRTIRKSFLPSTSNYGRYLKKGSQKYNTEEVILLDFVPTASIVFRKSLFVDPPRFYFNGVCGDLPLRLILGSKGYAYYFDSIMSAYRTGVPGSASMRALSSFAKIKTTFDAHIMILQEFDAYTDGQYHDVIQKAIELKLFTSLVHRQELVELKSERFRHLYDELHWYSKLKLRLYSFSPTLFRIARDLKRRLAARG